ncbi:MCE family protein [Rhodococcus opacus]|uniref:MCE family protein n=1 Tax=Rhodococcus opacus TaxID=37919 RepID=UPI000EA8B7B3|nr:MlaD family protein [Rhodococcus opacus]QZS56818.1 MCE family protein [Rhodococcus opacus]RKM76555.1 mammalian cell entry protein [Rhodococcus opacus]
MNRTALVRFQLVTFTVLSIVSLTYALISYVSIERITGLRTYTVTAAFADAGGLYENALVTYRGIDVGLVTSIDLAQDAHVRVSMQIKDAYPVPTASTAHIRSMSAVGEQFVDFVPTTDEGPYLVDGDTVPTDQTETPVPAGDVIESANQLLQSIPKDSLDKAVDETFNTFDGTGPQIAQLIDSSAELVRLAQADLEPTRTLINDAEPLLTTGNEVSEDITSFTTDLSAFTEQLVLSDGQIRAVLDQGPSAAATTTATLTDLQPTFPLLMANLQTVGQVFRMNIPELRQILVIYPALSAVTNHSVTGFQLDDDQLGPQAPLDIKLGNTLNPPPCTQGYQATERRDPSDTAPAQVPGASYCDVAPDDPKVSRGLRNTPCATDPAVRAPDVANCPQGLPSTWEGMLRRPGASPTPEIPAAPPNPAPAAVPYNDTDQSFLSPQGASYIIGTAPDPSAPTKEADRWQSLVIK